jgi:hypothetical protein
MSRKSFALLFVVFGCSRSESASAGDAGLGAVAIVSGVMIQALPKRVNPVLPGGQALYMGAGEGCHAIAADVEPDALMAAINKSEGTSCDGFRGDPAWQACPWGAVYSDNAGRECICRTSAAVPKIIPCPKAGR